MPARTLARLYPLLAAVGALYCSCTNSVSGVETTNGFTIFATSGSIRGTAPSYSRVFLFDTAYVPYIDQGTGFGTSVDADGMFNFTIPTGTYNVLVMLRDGSEAGMQRKIVVSDLPDTDAEAPEKRPLAKTGVINGSIVAQPQTTVLVYIAGTGYYRIINGSSSFSFPSVPPGPGLVRYALITTGATAHSYTIEIIGSHPVDIKPGRVTDIGELPVD